MNIDKLIDTIFDEEDLVKQKGGTLLHTVEETDGHAEWYLVYTDNVAPYYEEEGEFEEDFRYAEILLVTGGATSWNIDCTFDDDVAKNQRALDYLTDKRDGWRYDKWELMRMFDYDGKYSGLAKHIARRFRQLKGKGK